MKKIIILSTLIFGFAAFSNAQTSATSASADSPTTISTPETSLETSPTDIVTAQKAIDAVKAEGNAKKKCDSKKKCDGKKACCKAKKENGTADASNASSQVTKGKKCTSKKKCCDHKKKATDS